MCTEQSPTPDQQDTPESDTFGLARFFRLLAIRGIVVVSLSFSLQSEPVQQRLVIASCDNGATFTIPLDTLEEFLNNGCEIQSEDLENNE